MRSEQDLLIDAVVDELEGLAVRTDGRRPAARVIAALRHVPRAAFVPEPLRDLACSNRPLPIGYEQTISQPFIVALMTDLLELDPGDKVLEIGTGSGYQAAILSQLAAQVLSIERVAPLAAAAGERLRRLGYRNVVVRAGDGSSGWPEAAPFDAIIVTAAASDVPPALLAQLGPGGRLVLPLEQPGGEQVLVLIRRTPDGGIHHRAVLPVRFVPLLPGDWPSSRERQSDL